RDEVALDRRRGREARGPRPSRVRLAARRRRDLAGRLGGGNTSIKTVERDHRGREIGVLRVKGSGSDLKSVQRKDFPGVRMDDIRALLERQDMGDQEMVGYLAHALQDPDRKSVV